MRVPTPLARLKAALIGTRHIHPTRKAALAYLGAVVLVVLAAVSGTRRAFQTPPPGQAMARALALLPQHQMGFGRALEVTWERELRLAAELPRERLNLLVPRLPPALCLPPGGGSEPERQRRLATELDAALERRQSDPEGANAALDSLIVAPARGGGLAGALHAYNVARGHLVLRDTATAARLLAAVFADDTVVARRDALAELSAVVAYNTRLLAGIAALPARDTLALTHFRGAIRALKGVAPSHFGSGRVATYHDFPVPAGSFACGDGGEATSSMEAWVGLVGAYRQVQDYRDPDLADELERAAGEEYADDPLVPVLRLGRRVAAGRRTPIPENYFWAASNLQRIYGYNQRRPDARLELARAVLLLDVAADTQWTQAVAAVAPFDRCRVMERLAGEFGRGAGRRAGGAAPTDSLRAAVALLANGRLRACSAAAGAGVDPSLRSEFILLGAGLLGDTVGARAEAWRLSLVRGDSAPGGAASATPELARSEALARRLKPGGVRGVLSRGDSTYRFLRRWQEAVFAEVADSVRVRYTSDQLLAEQVGALPDALLGATRLAGRRPGGEAELKGYMRRHGASLGWGYRARAAAARYPEVLGLLVVLATAGLLLGATWVHLVSWRRSLLLDARLYLADVPDDAPFGHEP